MKYQFIEEHKREFPIVVMCGVLAVSESGFYAWRKRPTCQRKREDAHLKQEIRQVFEEHLERYGAPRIYRDLHDEGIKCIGADFRRHYPPFPVWQAAGGASVASRFPVRAACTVVG